MSEGVYTCQVQKVAVVAVKAVTAAAEAALAVSVGVAAAQAAGAKVPAANKPTTEGAVKMAAPSNF